jgi:transposase
VIGMGESRQHYNKEFKEKTVKYIMEQHKSLPDIANELNIPIGTLTNWKAKYRKFEVEPFIGTGNLRSQEKQLKEQENHIKDLEEEVAILKKAMHYFSKDRK